MNKILQDIFLNYKADFDKLINYGFIMQNDSLYYTTTIVNEQMKLSVNVFKDGHIKTEVFDLDSEEIYDLFLAENASGVFVGIVKTEYENALLDIRDKCFDKYIFKSEYSKLIENYVKEKYGDELEFLWTKAPNNAILRRKDSNKWYCAMLTTKAESIGLNGKHIVEIIDIMENPNTISNIIDYVNYFPAYHMNKKYWLTIKLDNCTLSIDKIFEHIDNSYSLANRKPAKNRG